MKQRPLEVGTSTTMPEQSVKLRIFRHCNHGSTLASRYGLLLDYHTQLRCRGSTLGQSLLAPMTLARPAVVVVGGGQAGLSLASCLRQRGIEPLVLERHRIAHAWQHQRWDSFCLVTPNWQCRLPGFPYDGDDPHGFMGREAIVGLSAAFRRAGGGAGAGGGQRRAAAEQRRTATACSPAPG